MTPITEHFGPEKPIAKVRGYLKMTPSILHVPSGYGVSARHYLIFFITGNPGLIAYYTTFLSTLHQLLESRPDRSSNAFHIFGRSFNGFEDEPEDVVRDKASDREEPYGLTAQIDLTLDALQAQRISTGPRRGQLFDGIILMGHSVGSFVLMEILLKARQAPTTIPRINAGFLLFPTVVDIAKSPSGVKATKLLKIPQFVTRVSTLVRGLMWLLPRSVVKVLVCIVTGQPDDSATVTTSFLKSKNGVWQAL
jgi:pimeloyl-ACP methyl ester carboxylesterase